MAIWTLPRGGRPKKEKPAKAASQEGGNLGRFCMLKNGDSPLASGSLLVTSERRVRGFLAVL